MVCVHFQLQFRFTFHIRNFHISIYLFLLFFIAILVDDFPNHTSSTSFPFHTFDILEYSIEYSIFFILYCNYNFIQTHNQYEALKSFGEVKSWKYSQSVKFKFLLTKTLLQIDSLYNLYSAYCKCQFVQIILFGTILLNVIVYVSEFNS